ncbi:cytochrome P450 [Schizophyllum commune]
MTAPLPTFVIAAALFITAYLYVRRRRESGKLFPPGPSGLPIIGNLFDVPVDFQWLKYSEWSKKFGSDIVHLDVGGMPVVVLHSSEACYDLLERRSSEYSSRADTPMLDLMGWEFQITSMKYGPRWREHRRAFHSFFNVDTVRHFRPRQQRATHTFLRRMLDASSSDLRKELRFMVASTIMDITYGIDALPENDPYTQVADRAFNAGAIAAVPNSYLVNIFPILLHLPEWMPGTGFKKHARKWRPVTEEMVNAPFEETMRRMASDSARSSFVSLSLEKTRAKNDLAQEEIVKNTAAIMYIGAMDTTVATLLSFTLHMLENPEIAMRARLELDSVLEPGRLPEFDDEERLPYTTAVVKETLRMYPAAPVAVPHQHTGETDDVYRGFTIPRGSVVIPNVWAMAHDEMAYPEPYIYKPERFLTVDGKLNPAIRDPTSFVFGFERRVCPGKHMALASIWLTIASTLRVYTIEKAKRSDGTTIEPKREYKSSTLQSPEAFECNFVPRSEAAVRMIRESMDQIL